MTPRLDALGIATTNLPASLAFYRCLGLEPPTDPGTAPHVEAAAGGLRIMWDAVEEAPPAGGPRLAFRCGTPGGVDGAYKELTGAGHRGMHEPWDAEWGQRYATVLDPDGNPVDLFAPLDADT
ncbi:VOC family protein [Streptomyces sulphureus]|uniref:VOC family protein n=1 Tax=Streptomyces sulphureus TaxID=47758 RepID=UPI00035E4905|nr:VOC family protein [Streptomyces sulphureus]